MILAQVFKTSEGAQKRARFEAAHCGGKYRYSIVRFYNDQLDHAPFDAVRFEHGEYTWRLDRTRKETKL